MLQRLRFGGDNLRDVIYQFADANESIVIDICLPLQAFEQKVCECAVTAAPTIVFKTALVCSRGKQPKNPGAALPDLTQILSDERSLGCAARGPSYLAGMASVGHQNHNSRVKALRYDSIKLSDLQCGGVEILRIGIVREQVAVALTFDDSVSCKEDIDDVVGLRAADEPRADCCSN